MKKPKKEAPVWWRDYTLDLGEVGHWKLGALTLWIQRHYHEWWIAHSSSNDPDDASLLLAAPQPGANLPQGEDLKRFAIGETEAVLHFKPLLPDRPVVSRPEEPFCVLAASEVTLFVSSPIWLGIDTGRRSRPLVELPLYRCSDTWFGGNTREGEICYASRTSCRHSLAELPPRPQRAVTPVRITNRSKQTLQIERINVPVPNLSLHAAADGSLWTLPLSIAVEPEQVAAEIEVGKKLHALAAGAKLVSAARVEEGGQLLTRALSALIG